MTDHDERLFLRAGEMLGQHSPAERDRDREHARVVAGVVATERRRYRRVVHQRRVALRAFGVAAFAVVAFVVARSPGIRGTGAPSSAPDVTFNFEDAGAQRVALVGEFNGWDARSTPMTRYGGTWRVRLPVPPGRHTYAFVVNDTVWTADPTAPRAPERWFGDPRSVIVVGNNP